MQEFPSNSQKARGRPDEPQLERVTSAEAVRRKPGLGRRFKEAFIVGNMQSARDYVIADVIVPMIQDAIIDSIQGGFERLIRGDSARRRPTGTTYGNVGRVNYAGMSNAPPTSVQPRRTTTMSRPSRARHEFDELVIQSRQEANDVIDRLFDILSRYGSVNVANLYELTGVEASHTDFKWGWTDLRGAKAVKLRSGGYLLDLPEPIPLS